MFRSITAFVETMYRSRCSACAVFCAASATLPRSTARSLGKVQARTTCSGVFVVKDIESRQTNVGDFFLIESNCCLRRQSIARRTNDCAGCATCERQGPSDSQYRHGFRLTPSLRSSLRVRHRKISTSDGRSLINEWPRPGLGGYRGDRGHWRSRFAGRPVGQLARPHIVRFFCEQLSVQNRNSREADCVRCETSCFVLAIKYNLCRYKFGRTIAEDRKSVV